MKTKFVLLILSSMVFTATAHAQFKPFCADKNKNTGQNVNVNSNNPPGNFPVNPGFDPEGAVGDSQVNPTSPVLRPNTLSQSETPPRNIRVHKKFRRKSARIDRGVTFERYLAGNADAIKTESAPAAPPTEAIMPTSYEPSGGLK